MSFKEKLSWVRASVTAVVAVWYGASVLPQLGAVPVDDVDRKDERDVRIGQRGDLAGYDVSSALMIGVLALTLVEAAHSRIANALFGALLVGGLLSTTVKLVAYRRGF